MTKKVGKSIGIVSAGVLLLALLAGLYIFVPGKADLYNSFASPDNRYQIEVYAYRVFMAFPGQSGDRPGYVILKDNAGNILNGTCIEMVQWINKPVWEKSHVSQNLIFDWDLPK